MKPIAPDLVSLIERQDPASMASLRAAFPDQQEALSSARELGETEPASQLSVLQRAAHLDVLRLGIPVVISSLDSLSRDLRQRMERVSNVRFWGTALAAASGGIAGILALFAPQDIINAIMAFVAMLSAITALFADHFDRAPSGVRVKTTDEFSRTLERRGEIEAIRIKIERDGILRNKDDEIRTMIASMDETAKRVRYLSAN